MAKPPLPEAGEALAGLVAFPIVAATLASLLFLTLLVLLVLFW